jgi:Domain of unknown function (DUF4411)
MYVFDNSPLSTLFRNYYRGRFPTLWKNFDALTGAGEIVSAREVYREIEDGPIADLRQWAANNQDLFPIPDQDEATFISQIYAIKHFQQNIEQQKLLKGGRNADPFVIAKAAVHGGIVVTMEVFKENGAKIPNICHHFKIKCLTLEQFMEAEGWQF